MVRRGPFHLTWKKAAMMNSSPLLDRLCWCCAHAWPECCCRKLCHPYGAVQVDLMSWTVSNLQCPFREDFSLKKSGSIAEKGAQIFGRRFVGFDRPKKRRPFSISKRALAAASETAGRRRPLRPYFLQQEDRSHGQPKHKSSVPLP